ncbi:MAG TPA: hypothetical protein VGF08_00320, partial [Terriglobales bacterium]
AGLFTAAVGTARDAPPEYGPGWSGFGKRYVVRLSGVATGNAIEAGLGAIWGEDPRYFRAPDEPFKWRVGNAILGAIVARNREGDYTPAYARYAAVVGNNFLSNTWREPSESSSRDAGMRVLWGVLGRMGSNAFQEFWPDVSRHIFHKKTPK